MGAGTRMVAVELVRVERAWRYFENKVKDLKWIGYGYKKKRRVKNDCKVFSLNNKKMDLP